jgi:hypothetical protein
MKPTYKALAFCALAALPLGSAIAGQTTNNNAASTEVQAEDAKTKTINLTVTGMR